MADGVKIRLLICAMCKSIEELPDYDGPQEHDDTGNYRMSFHRTASGAYHAHSVASVLKSDWDKPYIREAFVREITAMIAGTGQDGLGQEFYDVKSTFLDDALACWKKHGRPGSAHKTSCEDYKSDRMRLLPDTRAERKAEGLSTKNRPNTFLCQFCPYHRVVENRFRKSRGEYDKQIWEGN
jgi:hypothetical protein